MSAPEFLITGSGRSGTGYVARVLQECGLNVGHEAWWTLHRDPQPGLDGDCSWLGCFDRGYSGRRYAQVRDPRTAIPSIWGRENVAPYSLVRRVTVPQSGRWAEDAARIWLFYTRQAVQSASATRRWRVEDLGVAELTTHFGVDAAVAGRALDAVPHDVNAGEAQEYPWPTELRTGLVGHCMDLGRRLGYEIP